MEQPITDQSRGLRERTHINLKRGWPLLSLLVFLAALVGLTAFGFPLWQSALWGAALAVPAPLRLQTGARLGTWLSRGAWALGPMLGFLWVEVLNYNSLASFTPLQIALNLGFYYTISGVVYLIFGRRNLSCAVSTVLFWVIGMANHYVISFRGRTIFPGDLLTLDTAANVAGSYNYTFSDVQMTTFLCLLLFLLLLGVLPRQEGRSKLRLRSAIPAAALSAGFLVTFFCTPFLSNLGIEPSMWTTTGNGFILNFSVCLRYSSVSEPDGYSQDALHNIQSNVAGSGAAVGGGADAAVQPVNIIAIMNESFSDLSQVTDLQTNKDYLPFWRSLTENTVKGYAYSSVFGGTTANSEYEFLTGNSMAFLPAGTVPYQLYVKEGSASLVSQMNALGYTPIASHPYLSSGWNRPAVYRDLGFDTSLFQQDFQDPSYMRDYITDQSNFENLIRMYEEKEPGEKLFLFNVTMQNHSAYNVAWKNLPREVWLTGALQGRFSTVDQYLSLIYQSDKAFEYLVDYFAQIDEPTIILMFGDHQPQVATNFYSDILGQNPSLETLQSKYKVPFLLWANYDIQEADGVETSLNYLSSLLMETANLPQTEYQQFLSDLSDTVPALNANGYMDADGKWHTGTATLPEDARELLNQYQMLQYNELFDGRENRLTDFFLLPDVGGE